MMEKQRARVIKRVVAGLLTVCCLSTPLMSVYRVEAATIADVAQAAIKKGIGTVGQMLEEAGETVARAGVDYAVDTYKDEVLHQSKLSIGSTEFDFKYKNWTEVKGEYADRLSYYLKGKHTIADVDLKVYLTNPENHLVLVPVTKKDAERVDEVLQALIKNEFEDADARDFAEFVFHLTKKLKNAGIIGSDGNAVSEEELIYAIADMNIKDMKLKEIVKSSMNTWAKANEGDYSSYGTSDSKVFDWLNTTGYFGKNSDFKQWYKEAIKSEKTITDTRINKKDAKEAQARYQDWIRDFINNSPYNDKLKTALMYGVKRNMNFSNNWLQTYSKTLEESKSKSGKFWSYGAILSQLQGAKKPIEEELEFKSDKEDLIANPKEEMDAMIDKLDEITDVGASNRTTFKTFAVRVRYLVNAVERKDEFELDTRLMDYSDGEAVEYHKPTIVYLTPRGGEDGCPFLTQVDVKNVEAYKTLLYTLSELTYYRDLCWSAFSKDSWSTSLGKLQDEILVMSTMYEAISYLNCQETWDFWNEVNDSGHSLATIYNELEAADAFEKFDTYEPKDESSLNIFFDHETETLSTDILTGMAESAKYLAMQTNLYDPYTIKACRVEDFSTIDGFHYKYGYYRKALFKDTNKHAAESYYNAETIGDLQICTLKDLVGPNDDIVLYIDDNFYNADELQELQEVTRLNSKKSKSNKKSWTQASDIQKSKVEKVLKTGTVVKYSNKVDSNESDLILEDDLIKENIELSEYDILQPFAVVSSIYRNEEIKDKENESCVRVRPVFIASETLPQMEGVSNYLRNSIYNWALLQNLEENMSIEYTSNIDMNSPVFMDIYGNIITESGTVVVPVSANATLHTSDYYPASASFVSFYGDSYKIPSTSDNLKDIMEENFTEDPNTKKWLMNARLIDGVTNMATLSIADEEAMESLRNLYAYNLNNKAYDYSLMQHIIVEVLRGAPIEEIDDAKEGLVANTNYNRAGIQISAKLEELEKSLGTSKMNAVLSIPNLAYTKNMQYWALLVFKLCVIICVIIMCVIVYVDVVGTSLSWRTFFKCLLLPGIMALAAISIPLVFDVTYYQSNRALLQQETEYIAMLNQEKKESGKEIGVYSIETPDLSTKLYLKLINTTVNWYDIFGRVLFNRINENLDDVWSEYTENNFIGDYSMTEVMNDGVYVSLDSLFDSCDLTFMDDFKYMHCLISEEPVMSFYSPYYMILETLVSRMNQFNSDENIFSYATKLQSGGKLKTLGLCKPYFESEEFFELEGDYFDLCTLYGVTPDIIHESIFDESEFIKMRNSQWFNDKLPDDDIKDRAYKMTEHMKEYIGKNRNLIGRVTDDTFLKVMALDMAIYYNNLFGVNHANVIEIMNLSNDDLLRLATANKADVMKYSTMSFPRFTWELGGTPTSIAAAILICTNFIGSFVKPLAVLIAYAVVFLSLFIFKVLYRKRDYNISGFFITMLLLCGTNIVYAITVKLSVLVPNYVNAPPAACLIIQTIMQFIYMYVLIYVVIFALKDFRGLGTDKYNYVFDKLISRKHTTSPSEEVADRKAKDGRKYYEEMVRKQEERTGTVLTRERKTRIKGVV